MKNSRAAWPMRGAAVALLAHDVAQFAAAEFLQSGIGAGELVAAQHAAFEFADQQRTRLWL